MNLPFFQSKTEKEQKTQLEFLKMEYENTDRFIKKFSLRQLTFLYYTIAIFGGGLYLITDNNEFKVYKILYPYFTLIVYGLFLYDFLKILTLRGYQKYLSEEINKILKKDILNTSNITSKFVLDIRNNYYYLINIFFWIAIFYLMLYYSHGGEEHNCIRKGWGCFHLCLQFAISILFIVLFCSLRNRKDKVYNYLKNKNTTNSL